MLFRRFGLLHLGRQTLERNDMVRLCIRKRRPHESKWYYLMASLGPFDFLKSINDTKVNLMVDDISEKAYSPFIVNRGLSLFVDTIMLANEMNIHRHLENKLQYVFFINTIKKKKRYSKWPKKSADKNIEVIKQYYSYNTAKAQQVLPLFTPAQLNELKRKLNHGGR